MGVIERITIRCVVLNFGQQDRGRPLSAGRRRPAGARSLSGNGLMSARMDHRECHHRLRQGGRAQRRLAVDRARPHHLPARLERLRQDYADPLDSRADAGRAPAGSPSRAGHHPALPTHQGDRRRRRLHPGGPQGVSEIHGRGKLAARRLPGGLGGRNAAAGSPRFTRSFRASPSGATQLAGTMSGGEQAMVSIGRGLMRAPKVAADRRALARPFAPSGTGEFPHHPGHQRPRHYGFSGRAERAPDARDRASWLCAVEGPGRGVRNAGGTRRACRSARGLFRLSFPKPHWRCRGGWIIDRRL